MDTITACMLPVSIIFPVYNAERYLKECLDSLLAQTMREFEIICVDDGSTDHSVQILETYAQKDRRIQILHQKNQTAGAARNQGMSVAKGEYLLFLDADVFCSEKLVETAYRLAKESEAEVVLWGVNNCIMPKKKIEKASWYLKEDYLPVVQPFAAADIPRDVFRITETVLWNKLFRRSYIEKHQLQFQTGAYANYMYFVSMGLMLAQRIVWTPESLVTYRRGNNPQGKRERNAKALYEALKDIRDAMLDKGILELYREAYLEFARSVCDHSFKVLNAKERKAAETFLGLIPDRAQDIDRNQNIKISIAVAVYNTEKYLRTCMDSLVNQTWKNIEIICVNDCSTDNSLEVLREYAQRDPRVIIIDKPQNEKLMRARMSAVEAATGDYLIFVDSDDYIELDTCEYIAKEIRKNQVDIIHYCIDAEIESGNKKKAEWYKRAFSPYEGTLLDADILRYYYITQKVTTALFGKAYKTNLIQRVYASIPDISVYIGEDIFASFFIAMHARSYVGMKGKGLYHYRYDLGVSNDERMSLEKFAIYNDMSKLVQETKRYIEERKYTRVQGEALLAMAKRMLEDVLRIFEQNRLRQEDVLQAEGMMAKQWCMIPGSGELIERKLGKSVSQIMNTYCPPPVYQKLSRNRMLGKAEPLVSVIIPAFNCENYVGECIDSVIAQDKGNIEVLCINDGSYDNTLSVIETYYEKYDSITIISKLNGGQSSARNEAMKWACGKYILFLDSDDMLKNDIIEKLITCADEQKLDFVGFDADSFSSEKEVMGNDQHLRVYSEYYHRQPIYTDVFSGIDLLCEQKRNNEWRVSVCLMLIRREWLLRESIWFEEGIIHEDNLFTFCCYLHAKRCTHIPERGYLRRIRAESTMTSRKSINHARGYYACYLGMTAETRKHHINAQKYPEIQQIIIQIRRNALNICEQLIKEKRFVPQTTYDALMQSDFELVSTQKENKKRLEEICNSRSYRIGREITWLPRKIRGGLRCMKQNGMDYTVKLFLERTRKILSNRHE